MYGVKRQYWVCCKPLACVSALQISFRARAFVAIEWVGVIFDSRWRGGETSRGDNGIGNMRRNVSRQLKKKRKGDVKNNGIENDIDFRTLYGCPGCPYLLSAFICSALELNSFVYRAIALVMYNSKIDAAVL